MFFKSHLLVALLMLSAVLSYAQRTETFFLYKTREIPGHCPVNMLRVIDQRANKDNIGSIKVGGFNKKLKLVTEKPFAEHLSEHFKKMIQSSSNGNEELVLVLYNINVQDRITEEVGSFHFDGEFFRGSDGKYFHLGTYDSLAEVGGQIDITKSLLRTVDGKIQAAIYEYALMSPKKNGPIYSYEEMLDRRMKEKRKYPIYNTSEYKKGICYTVEQFLNNNAIDTPFTISSFATPGVSRHVPIFYTGKKGKKTEKIPGDSFFAAYNGQYWILGNGQECSLMEFKNNDFYSQAYLKGANSIDDVMMAGAMFGLVGGLIAGATHKDQSFNSYHVKFNPEHKIFVPVSRSY